MNFTRDPSNATCKVSDIESFVFGGFSSRFWLLRKHIISMPRKDIKNLPFFCWQCITLSTKERDINLVIKNQKDMRYLLEFLIISMKTVDGRKNSAIPVLYNMNNYIPSDEENKNKSKRLQQESKFISKSGEFA